MSEEGIVELKIERFSEFVDDNLRDDNPETQDRLSIPTYIYGLSWEILAYPKYDLETLAFYVECNAEEDDPNWSCQASVKFQIVSQKAGVDDLVWQIDHEFSPMECRLEFEESIECAELLDPQKGFIEDDVVILRALVKTEMPESVRLSKLRAFASFITDSPDVTLILGRNKIPIHKMYLSYYSEYFRTMFRSTDFIEGGQDEIVLEQVGYVDMLELLYVIYPPNPPITDKNLKVILKLADRFIMPAVLERCKNWLQISKLNGAQKLLLAQQYNFKDLLKELAKQCKTDKDGKKLKAQPEYEMLDSETRLLILDSIIS